jgi:hypothetical protein
MARHLMRSPYDYRNCQSLFGYAAEVHRRSGGVCQLCGAGQRGIDFDLWRQLTVEHLIGTSQGGYLVQIRTALREKLPTVPAGELEGIAQRIDAANTITACSFCNSTTSRAHAPTGMFELIREAPDDPEVLVTVLSGRLDSILDAKRAEVAWKLRSIRQAFDQVVAPQFEDARRASSGSFFRRPDAPDTEAGFPARSVEGLTAGADAAQPAVRSAMVRPGVGR